MITREQVDGLQVGDTVEVFDTRYLLTVRGQVYNYNGTLWIGNPGHTQLTERNGEEVGWAREPEATLTVISRDPRPLYVNHPRTEPVPGDVVRDADNDEWNGWLYLRGVNGRWLDSSRGEWFGRAMPSRLRLLVDGETGQVVP